jgi:hypothetical protein
MTACYRALIGEAPHDGPAPPIVITPAWACRIGLPCDCIARHPASQVGEAPSAEVAGTIASRTKTPWALPSIPGGRGGVR